jgi:hypothetical protein
MSIQPHPTHAEAKLLMKSFSNRDLSMIYKMSKLPFQADESERYLRAWRRWLDNKGPDISIIFGDDEIVDDVGRSPSRKSIADAFPASLELC